MNDKSNEIEFEEAVKQAEEDNGASVYVHEFKRPFEYMGKKYDRLTFDYGSLTGRDSLTVENDLQAKGVMVMVPTFSGPYLIRIAARACKEGIGIDALEKMSIADYNRIRSRTRNFLLGSEQ